MDSNSKEFISAVEAFFEGKSTDNQERMLKDILSWVEEDELTDELRPLKLLLSGNGQISGEQFDTSALTAAVADAATRRTGRLFRAWSLAGAFAAAAIAVAVVFSSRNEPQIIYGYDINGEAILDVDSALEVMGSMNLLSALEESMDDAMNLINSLSTE